MILFFKRGNLDSSGFFYKIKGNDVWVVAVWHGAQLPDEPAN